MLYHGPLVKGILRPISWKYMQAFPQTQSESNLPPIGMSQMLSEDEGGDDPDPSPPASAVFCATIAEAKSKTDGTYVELQCRPVQNPTEGHFTMAEDGTSDTITVYCSRTINATDRINRIIGTMKTYSGNRVLCVDNGPGFNPAVDQMGSLSSAASGTIAWAKTFPSWTPLPTDGRAHALELKLTSWCDGYNIYIEEEDRSSGILINAELPPSDEPHLANVDGLLIKPVDGSEVYILGFATYTPTTSPIRPLGVNNKSIAQGLDLSGLLVRVWGKVTVVNTTDGYIYIDDGTRLMDGTQTDGVDNIGIRVLYTDDYYPSVGEFAIINGPLTTTFDYGTYNYVKCIRSCGLLDATLFPPPVPTGLTATGSNGKVLLDWDKMNAARFRVYRSASESGIYSFIGESSENCYSDSLVINGSTYWYKISAVNGDSEGTSSGPVSATPTASAPVVSINSATIDANGLLTLQCTGSCSQGTVMYTLSVDGNQVWIFNQSDINNLVYDTTQLTNGLHKFEIAANSGNYYATASQTINVQNFISEFNVPDDMCGIQPISAKFQNTTNWSLTISQGSSTLYSTNGSGNSMQVFWDAGNTCGDFQVALAAGGKTRTVKSRKENTSSGGSYYSWASVYVKDSDSLTQGNFQYMHQAASSALQAKYGVSIYSGRLNNDTDWQNIVIDSILNGDIPVNHLAIAGHGVAGVNSEKNPLWQGIVLGQFPGSSYSAGSGLTAFLDITPYLRLSGNYIPVGPAIGNTLNWDHTTGRISNWNCSRRLRFVYIGACRAGQGVFSLAFGTPRGRYPGRGRAFLSFKDEVPGGYAQIFSEKFWAEWRKSNVTIAQAATSAYWHVKNQTGYKINYVLHGDPNLLIK